MKGMAIVLIIVVFLGFSSNVFAEEQQEMTPELQKQFMEQTMNTMIPFMGQMMKIMMQVHFEVLAEPNTAEKLASYTRNYYDALIKKGFTKEESLSIAMNMGIPSLPNIHQ